MFFKDYRQHKNAHIRHSLFWEYDMEHFDWQLMKTVVVQRVIERGRMDDFYAILNMYGLHEVKESIKKIPTMSAKDISFVCNVFRISRKDLLCYTKKQSTSPLWNS